MPIRLDTRRARAILLCCLVSLNIAAPTFGQNVGDKVHVDIPAQSLSSALTQFGRDTGTEILFTPESVNQKVSSAVKGDFAKDKAIALLLAGTGLTYRITAQGAIVINGTSSPDRRKEQTSGSGAAPSGTRVAPSDQAALPISSESTDVDQKSEHGTGLDEVVITGTNITGVDNKTVPMLTFDRDAIERSGYATTQDFLATIPQNYKSSSNSADGALGPGEGLNNLENSTAANLRGLGVSSTLTLLDGHRLAAAAYGTGVDLSMIPLSAVERIEVLTDGSSAVYGADAVGGVVNVILRKDFNGAETSARLDTLARGGGEQKQFDQSLGKTWGSGGALLVFRFEDDNIIHAWQRDFTANLPEPTDVYPSSKRYSGVFTGHQTLTDSLETFADALIEHYDGFRAFTTSGEYGDEQLLTPKTNSDSANLGIRWHPFGDWHLEGDTLFSQVDTLLYENFTPTFPGYTNGDPYLRHLDTIKEFDLKLDGTLWASGGTSLKGAVGAAYSREDFSALYPYLGSNQPDSGPPLDRRVSAEFAELYAPVISSDNAVPLVRKLELSAAVRRDAYSDFGNKIDPRVGVFWSPIDPIGIRASFSTSFRAPSPIEEATAATANAVYIESGLPFPNGTTGNAIFYGNQVLGPETSRNLNLGLDFQPPPLPGTRFSLNYYRIVYSNRLIGLNPEGVFASPQVYGPLITNFANDAAAAAFVAALNPPQMLYDFTSGGTGLAGVRAAFPYGYINAAKETTSGFDASAHSQVNLSGKNRLIFDLSATYIREIETTFCDTCTSTDLVNTTGQPLKLRARATAGWSDGTWSTNAAANYQSAYADTNLVPSGHIASWTTADFNANYRLPWTPVVILGLSIINAFNASPPRTSPGYNQLEYDPANADPRGRVLSLLARVQL
jgi:iron complex outermembrane receptor protein